MECVNGRACLTGYRLNASVYFLKKLSCRDRLPDVVGRLREERSEICGGEKIICRGEIIGMMLAISKLMLTFVVLNIFYRQTEACQKTYR